MQSLGPFGAGPLLAAGVSGGAHSLALALLGTHWARQRGGSLLALIVDHGLRHDSAAEAATTAAQLARHGIAARIMTLRVEPGPGLQARAREARLAAMLDACAAAGRPWLLLGHHRADQAETVLLRGLAGSRGPGLAGMIPARPAGAALILRPLLGVAPAALEAVCAAAGLVPARDPSNADPRFTRVRVRASLADPAGTGDATAALAEAAHRFASRRARLAAGVAARLAAAATLHPTGAVRLDLAALGDDAIADAAMAALLRVVSGRAHAPAVAAVAALRRRGGGTLGGARLTGRLLLREAAAMAPPVPASPGAIWDGRFRLVGPGDPAATLGALGLETPPGLPPVSAVLRPTLPAIRRAGVLLAIPPLCFPSPAICATFALLHGPSSGPATGL